MCVCVCVFIYILYMDRVYVCMCACMNLSLALRFRPATWAATMIHIHTTIKTQCIYLNSNRDIGYISK